MRRSSSEIMHRVGSRDTSPEVLLRKALWAKGLRFRTCRGDLPGKPDVALAARHLVVFVDGDYWHGNQWRLRGLASLEEQFKSTTTRDYWLRKIRRNMERDCRVTSELLKTGWTVIRLWESQISRNLEMCVDVILESIEQGALLSPRSMLSDKTVLEFFAGLGLMRMGLERHGWCVSYANYIDPQKISMYKGHFGEEDVITLDDIHRLSADTIPSATLATASFPCNDLSLAGAREGLAGKSSSAFWGFTEIIERMGDRRPPLVLLENVPGFLTSHGGRDFLDALLELNRLGYGVDTFMLDAISFVPQSRKRLFVVGTRDQGLKPEETITTEDLVRPKALLSFVSDHPEVRWRTRRLPSPPPFAGTLESVLEDLSDTDPEWWNSDRGEYLLSQMSPRHRELANAMIAGERYSYATVFRRVRHGRSMAELRTDGVAGCLRTPRGGSGRQILFRAGKGKFAARLLTPRECARLMGADHYQMDAPLNQALFGFGDAVCVPVAEWVAQYYLNPLVNELLHAEPLTWRSKEAELCVASKKP